MFKMNNFFNLQVYIILHFNNCLNYELFSINIAYQSTIYKMLLHIYILLYIFYDTVSTVMSKTL